LQRLRNAIQKIAKGGRNNIEEHNTAKRTENF